MIIEYNIDYAERTIIIVLPQHTDAEVLYSSTAAVLYSGK
jgi:hypothetical protein